MGSQLRRNRSTHRDYQFIEYVASQYPLYKSATMIVAPAPRSTTRSPTGSCASPHGRQKCRLGVVRLTSDGVGGGELTIRVLQSAHRLLQRRGTLFHFAFQGNRCLEERKGVFLHVHVSLDTIHQHFVDARKLAIGFLEGLAARSKRFDRAKIENALTSYIDEKYCTCMSKSPKRVREPVQVYLDQDDRDLLLEAARISALPQTEILRRGLRRVAADLLAQHRPGASLDQLIGSLGTADDIPADLAARHDEYLYRSGEADDSSGD